MLTIEKIIAELQDYYAKNAKNKPMDYTFGFFDAIGVLRDMQIQMPK